MWGAPSTVTPKAGESPLPSSDPASSWLAVVGASLPVVKLLIARGAPIEQLNGYGGTPLGQAGWSFVNGDPDADYVPIFDALLAGGAHIEDGWLAWIDRQRGRTVGQRGQIAEVLHHNRLPRRCRSCHSGKSHVPAWSRCIARC